MKSRVRARYRSQKEDARCEIRCRIPAAHYELQIANCTLQIEDSVRPREGSSGTVPGTVEIQTQYEIDTSAAVPGTDIGLLIEMAVPAGMLHLLTATPHHPVVNRVMGT